MTARGAVGWADSVKPNAFTEQDKLRWLDALEGRIMADVFLMAPVEIALLRLTYPEDLDTPLIVKPPHDDLYVHWLAAKIDEANGEYDKYQNSMQIYNGSFGSFLRWFAGLYDPAEGHLAEGPGTVPVHPRREGRA